MALTLITQPNQHHPAYNPIVFAAQANTTLIPGFRFIFTITENTSGITQSIATFRVAPLPASAGGYIDISKIIQNQIENKIEFNESTALSDGENYKKYSMTISNEYSYFWAFTDYQFAGYWVRLVSNEQPFYKAGDLIEIKLNQVYGDNRDLLNGLHTVVADPVLVSGDWRLEISIIYSTIGDGPATPGETYFADRRKLQDMVPPLSYPDTPIQLGPFYGYNEAVPFVDFPNWTESLVLPTNDEEPLGDILTNSPNWFETQKEKDKYIIKPYQNLYWNAFNNPSNNDGVTYANTMIVENEFGDKWMLVDYTNWDDATIKMRQFNCSTDNQNWINITPNFGNTGGYQYGINPYTHITSTGELRESRYLDYWTTFAPGNDDCDEIILFIQLDPTVPGPPTEDYTFIARPVGRGFNGRRIYSTIIDDKYAVIWSDILSPSVRNWKITFTSGNPIQPATQYQSFAKRTSNALPFGQSYAISNSVDAWKAFDGNPTTFYQTTDNSGVATITYNFSSGAIRWADIQSYTINKGGATINAPTAWRVEASQDASTWTVVHTVTANFTNATYNSPQLGGVVKWNYVRLVVTGAFAPPSGPTNVRIFEFSINSTATVATMISGNNCPIDLGFTPWSWTGPNPPVGMTATVLETFANGPFTFPTLKKRRVYLDYDCEINTTQLLFLDRAGSYSSFAFPLRVIERGTNEKLIYKNEIGFITGDGWTYNTYDSETKTYNSKVEKTYTLTTDWLNTSMSDYFEELITSPEVYIKLNSETDNGRDGEGQPSPWLACTVIDSDFINPKQKNKRLINRTITVRLNSNNSINI
jgi:hypothetical protein